MLGLLLAIAIVGFIAGGLARAILPGDDSMGIGSTILLGVAGSFVGGFLGYLLFNKDSHAGLFQPSGLVGSIIGAIVLLAIMRRYNARTA